jgi:P27 family predicted phage terminase small subunit
MMAIRGPKPKPIALKILEGNRSRRPIDPAGTLRPDAGAPDAPDWLHPLARVAWGRLTNELCQHGVLTRLDRDALAALCQTVARVEILENFFVEKSAELGDPVAIYFDITPNGLTVQSAYYQVLKREQEHLHKQLECFGLRPDARSRVSIAAPVRAKLQSVAGAGQPETDAGFADFD